MGCGGWVSTRLIVWTHHHFFHSLLFPAFFYLQQPLRDLGVDGWMFYEDTMMMMRGKGKAGNTLAFNSNNSNNNNIPFWGIDNDVRVRYMFLVGELIFAEHDVGGETGGTCILEARVSVVLEEQQQKRSVHSQQCHPVLKL